MLKFNKLPEKQQVFIRTLIETGSKTKAAKASGYAVGTSWELSKKLAPYIEQELAHYLAMKQIKAVKVIDDTLGDGAVKVKQDLRLKAAQDVLDRGGLIKKTSVTLEGDALPAIMILPPKE